MKDVERELRELLERKARSVGGVAPRLPETVRKRGRRRQAGTAAVGVFTVAAVALVSFAGLRAIDVGSNDSRVPGADRSNRYEVFERTATIETVTITSPSDWHLVNQWPLGAGVATTATSAGGSCAIAVSPGETEPQTEACEGGSSPSPEPVAAPRPVPLLLLSRTDPGLGGSPCLQGSIELANDAAMLEVAIDVPAVQQIEAGGGPTLPSWPVAFDEEAVTDGPCGPGHYVRFEAGLYPYVAWIGFGPQASDDVRRSLFDIANRMRLEDARLARPADEIPGYVIAGGENAAGPWRLELRPSTSGGPDANVDLHLISSEGGAGTGNFTVPDATTIEQAGGDPTFGVVSKEASGVELRLEEGTPPIPATLVPLPPSLAYPFDLFFASNPSDVAPTAVPLGLDAPDASDHASSPTPVSPIGRRTVAEGATGGTEWTLEYSDVPGTNSVILRDRHDGSILAKLGPAAFDRLHASGLEFRPEAIPGGSVIIFGVAAPEAKSLAIALRQGSITFLTEGDQRWDPLPILTSTGEASVRLWWSEIPLEVGQVVTFNDRCELLARKIFIPDHVVRPPFSDEEVDPRISCPI